MAIRFEFRPDWDYDLRRTPEVREWLEAKSEEVAARANAANNTDGYKTSSRQGARRPQGRWRTTVIASGEAARLEAHNQVLLRALNG